MKMRDFTTLLLLLLVLCCPTLARTEYNDTADVSVTFPDSWTVEMEDDDMRLRQEDRSSVVLLSVVDAADLEEAATNLNEEMGKWIDNPVPTKQQEESFNGMPAVLKEGTGTIKGAEARWVVVIFENNKKYVMIVGVAKDQYWDPSVGDVMGIITSVKPGDATSE
jgi:hypothetical protein